jgi:hypothetical protein
MKPQNIWARLVCRLAKDKGIRAALIDRGRHNYGSDEASQREPDTIWTWFYAFKAAVCLKLQKHFTPNEEEGESEYDYLNGVEIGWHSGASYFSLDCMNAYGWNTVYVGIGVFRNWWAEDMYDTNC